MIRIVSCIDFNTNDPEEAYRQWRLAAFTLQEAIPNTTGNVHSSDEWYVADGGQLDIKTITKIRKKAASE